MNKLLISGIVLIVLAVTAGVAMAHFQVFQPDDSFAQVTGVTPVLDSTQKQIGFEVSYRWHDKTGVVRMDQAPGERIPLRGGELVLNP